MIPLGLKIRGCIRQSACGPQKRLFNQSCGAEFFPKPMTWRRGGILNLLAGLLHSAQRHHLPYLIKIQRLIQVVELPTRISHLGLRLGALPVASSAPWRNWAACQTRDEAPGGQRPRSGRISSVEAPATVSNAKKYDHCGGLHTTNQVQFAPDLQVAVASKKATLILV